VIAWRASNQRAHEVYLQEKSVKEFLKGDAGVSLKDGIEVVRALLYNGVLVVAEESKEQ
jgi:hypothetical protein